MKLQVEQFAPDFSLPDQNGAIHKLSDYKGKWVVLYFYPKDDTPGCTTEACTLRDNLPHFGKINAVVLGVSADTVLSHKKFSDKYNLPFTILADDEKRVVEMYDVWQEKSFMGKKSMGIVRTTFLIDPEGRIAQIYEKVDPETHAKVLLQDLSSLVQ